MALVKRQGGERRPTGHMASRLDNMGGPVLCRVIIGLKSRLREHPISQSRFPEALMDGSAIAPTVYATDWLLELGAKNDGPTFDEQSPAHSP